MQKKFLSLFLFIFLVLSFGKIEAQVTNLSNGSILLEDFESYEVGTIPDTWYNQRGNRRPARYTESQKEEYQYHIEIEDNEKFLRFEGSKAKHLNFPLTNENKDNIYNINLYETPILSWKVRAHKLPEKANEKLSDLNDSVASIYVVFDMGRVALVKKVPKSIRYTWSSTLPEGETGSKLFGNQQIIVVESGEQKVGKWVTFERNLVEDYRRMFGDDPPKNPIAILILSDGDSTNSYVKADYDDIMLKPEK